MPETLVARPPLRDRCVSLTFIASVVKIHFTEWGAPIGPEEAIAYTNLYWSFSNAPGRSDNVAPTAEIEFTSTTRVPRHRAMLLRSWELVGDERKDMYVDRILSIGP